MRKARSKARTIHTVGLTYYIIIYYHANKVYYKEKASYQLFIATSRQSHTID